MSTLGLITSSATRKKIAKTKQLDRSALIQTAQTYIADLQADPDQLPTLTKLALRSHCTVSTLHRVATDTPDLFALIDTILTMQEDYLITRGITDKINPRMAQFLLKAKHNYNDQPQQLTQNNTFNISPDILREALELMNKNPD